MTRLIEFSIFKNSKTITNNYGLTLYKINSNLYASAKECSSVLEDYEQINPLASLISSNISTEDDLLIDVLILNESIVLKNKIPTKIIKPEYLNKTIFKTYLMFDENTFLTKIGRSKNPRVRERTLQSEKPTITLFAICDLDVETKLHKIFNKLRVRGEWFKLNKDQINSIIGKYNFKIITGKGQVYF